jgi:hypothetical protein
LERATLERADDEFVTARAALLAERFLHPEFRAKSGGFLRNQLRNDQLIQRFSETLAIFFSVGRRAEFGVPKEPERTDIITAE